MATTSNTYTGNGTNKLFSITFPYLNTTDIDVYLNGTLQTVTTQYTFANATTVEFVTAPANGAVVLLDRSTDDSALAATFFPGSSIKAADLNENFDQVLYLAQESGQIRDGTITSAKIANNTIINDDINASAGITATKLAFTQSGTGATVRTVDSKLKESVSVKDFGAVGDGVANDTVAIFNAIQTGKPLFFPSGTYSTTTALVFSQYVTLNRGAKLITSSSLTFNGGFDAPIAHVLETTGAGFLSFNSATTTAGHPEWLGAVVNNVGSAAANTAAINACLDVFQETLLTNNVYYVNDTIKIEKSGRRLTGFSPFAPESNANQLTPGKGSVICSTSSWKDVVYIGKDTLGAFAAGIYVTNILATRNTAVVPPNAGTQFNLGSPTASGVGAPASFRVEYVAYSALENCVGSDSSIGFAYYSVLGLTCRKCIASRSVAGTTSVNDVFYGHLINNPNSVVSPVGVYLINSCHLEYCASVIFAGGLSTKIGFYMKGMFTDTILFKCEANLHDFGFFIEGTGETTPSIDNFIIACTADQPLQYGYRILNVAANSVITLQNNYSANGPSAASATAHYSIEGCYTAQIKLVGNQGVGDVLSNGTCTGLQIINSGLVESIGNSWVSLRNPIVLSAATNSYIVDQISDFPYGTPLARGYAITASNPARLVIDCAIVGNTNAFTGGVQLTGGITYNEIRCSRINASAVTGGNKLTSGGTAVTVAGAFGTANLASGILV